jgi:hypothetical protein
LKETDQGYFPMEGRMRRDKKGKAMDRRNFLLAVSGGTAAIVTGPIAASTEAHAYDPGNEETKARYFEGDDVKAFYRTNGYETLRK